MISYDDIYRTNSHYKMGAHRRVWVRDWLAKLTPGRVLDIGCGRGEAMRFAAALGYDAHGIETAPSLCTGNVIEGSVLDIPESLGRFDLVLCLDVLEHLEADEIEPALNQIKSVSDSALISIGLGPAMQVDGVDLHITQHTPAVWASELRSVLSGAAITEGYNSPPSAVCFFWSKAK
jgi:SAM-dependent methyltransferase